MEDEPHPAVNAVFSFVNQLEVAVGTRVPWPFGMVACTPSPDAPRP